MNVNRKFSMSINYKSNFPTSPICYNASNFYFIFELLALRWLDVQCVIHVHVEREQQQQLLQ